MHNISVQKPAKSARPTHVTPQNKVLSWHFENNRTKTTTKPSFTKTRSLLLSPQEPFRNRQISFKFITLLAHSTLNFTHPIYPLFQNVFFVYIFSFLFSDLVHYKNYSEKGVRAIKKLQFSFKEMQSERNSRTNSTASSVFVLYRTKRHCFKPNTV